MRLDFAYRNGGSDDFLLLRLPSSSLPLRCLVLRCLAEPRAAAAREFCKEAVLLLLQASCAKT